MDESAYQKHLEMDRSHFWRIGKRRLVLRWLTEALKDKSAPRFLDIGSACTIFPDKLSKLGDVIVVDPHRPSVEAASKIFGLDARYGALPENIPFAGKVDVISMLDVLEHIEDEKGALNKVYHLLEDDGVFILTVPACQWLWTQHDEILHHYRRYSKKRLKLVLQDAGFQVGRISYYTCLLFPLAVVQRLLSRLQPKEDKSEYNVKVPHPIINTSFDYMMQFEALLLRFVNLPYGLSLIAICRKQ